MNAHDEDRIKKLLRQALPPVDSGAEPTHDLWPAVLRRLDASPGALSGSQPRSVPGSIPWFDWALIAGLLAFAAFFPATIPVFLYYL
jgi:hypothetical protein